MARGEWVSTRGPNLPKLLAEVLSRLEKPVLGLQGTLDAFSLAEVLGLVERARQTGALDVRGPEGQGSLYVTAGRFCGGEAADYSGPVEGREALQVRLVDVCFHLFRFTSGSFEFEPNRVPSWPADRGVDIAPIVETVEIIVREWPAVEALVPSFDARLEINNDLNADSVTLGRAAFRTLTCIDGHRTVRQVARELGRSLVEIAPIVKELVEQGAVRVCTTEAARAPEPESALLLPSGALHAVRESETGESGGEVVTSLPDPTAELDRDAIDRERASLAARAGLQDPGPVPAADSEPEPEDTTEHAVITRIGVPSSASSPASGTTNNGSLATISQSGDRENGR